MDAALSALLGDRAGADVRAMVASAAAAGRAQGEHRPNMGRILAAAARADTVRALVLERLAAEGSPAIERLGAEREHQHATAAALAEALLAAEQQSRRDIADELGRLLAGARATARLLDAAAASLVRHADVSDDDVSALVYVCGRCARASTDTPDGACPVCGAGDDLQEQIP